MEVIKIPKYRKHEKSHETFLKNADDFCIETIDKYKKHSSEIASIAQRLHTQLHRANNIKVTNSMEKDARHYLQIDSYSLILTLGEKMKFCSSLEDSDIDVDKLEGWLNKKGEVQSWISSWINNDKNRYKEIN